MKPTLILVGADKGGVGKTTTSRALLDFLARRNILARAFDTENPRGGLHRFHPGITEIINLEEVADQMKVLDTLETTNVGVTVVDLKAGAMSTALQAFEDVGALEAAKNGDFNLGLVHVIGPSIASLNEMGEIAKFTDSISYETSSTRRTSLNGMKRLSRNISLVSQMRKRLTFRSSMKCLMSRLILLVSASPTLSTIRPHAAGTQTSHSCFADMRANGCVTSIKNWRGLT